MRAAVGDGLSLLDAIGALAAEHDLAFAPKPGRRAQPGGQQVYALGGVSLFVDADKALVFARPASAEPWRPITLGTLLELARLTPAP
ncbi:hypothetical protein T492DRAFT_968998 [Pavlovales sp. CCMP2436]|nr:hypothetical protein T492DRAFT_968998 [Pavlovales sp. CCMP2436]